MNFDTSGVSEIVEYGIRLAGRQNKLSTRFSILADVLRESNYWASKDQAKQVGSQHVRKAIDERIERVKLLEEKIQEMIEEGSIMIDVNGAVVGQVNGLSVYDVGEYAFGKPSRITAKTAMGKAGIINIEREADMSGPTHNKGMLILGGYLRGKYAQNKPLVLSASIAFEQSYSGIDGDSASSTMPVYDVGEYAFGKPSRITAKTAMGKAGIINIEREADMSGPTHNKGMLILGGYLRGKYAQNKPLVLSASIAFEQSYSGVDGDSASSTEVYALLSSLAEVPLRQDLAVTGSINQHGEIQPIGGVTQKIEGFYNVCKAHGLTGKQGVLIPHQNVKDLMLRHDVVEAVRRKKFHIYTVKSIDEGIELLTGKPAGNPLLNGKFTHGSINALVDAKLSEYVKHQKKLGG